jgi:hypothetical protein
LTQISKFKKSESKMHSGTTSPPERMASNVVTTKSIQSLEKIKNGQKLDGSSRKKIVQNNSFIL